LAHLSAPSVAPDPGVAQRTWHRGQIEPWQSIAPRESSRDPVRHRPRSEVVHERQDLLCDNGNNEPCNNPSSHALIVQDISKGTSMRAAVLGAGMALVLISQPATSQTLGTGHKSGVLSGGIGLTRHTGGAGPSRFTALGGHAGFGVTPGAVSISTGMARPAAVTVSSGLTPVRGFAAPSLHAVVPTIPPGGGAALDVRTAVPTAPVRGGVGITSRMASIGTGVARPAAVAAPSGASADIV
jgi:hypothetical protein